MDNQSFFPLCIPYAKANQPTSSRYSPCARLTIQFPRSRNSITVSVSLIEDFWWDLFMLLLRGIVEMTKYLANTVIIHNFKWIGWVWSELENLNLICLRGISGIPKWGARCFCYLRVAQMPFLYVVLALCSRFVICVGDRDFASGHVRFKKRCQHISRWFWINTTHFILYFMEISPFCNNILINYVLVGHRMPSCPFVCQLFVSYQIIWNKESSLLYQSNSTVCAEMLVGDFLFIAS